MEKRIALDDVCEKKIATLSSQYDGLIDYVDISSVDNVEKRIVGMQCIPAKEAPSRAKQLLEVGDILIATVRPNLNAVAMVEEATNNLIVGSTGYCVLRCNDQVDRRYVYYFCQSPYFVDDMTAQATGASYPAVSTSIVKSACIPVRSIDEQRMIADKFDQVSDLIALRKEQLAKLDELVKARFVEMFGSLNNNEKGLDIVPIEELCLLIKDGTHQTPTYTEDTQNGFKFLSSKDVMTQKICWDDVKYIPAELHEKLYATIQPKRNDILMSKNGVNYGIAAVNDTDEVFDIYVSLALLRPRTDRVNPVYLRCAINNPDTMHQFDSSIKGIGVPNLHLGEIKKTKILLPLMDKQNEFVSFVEQTNKTKLTIQASLDKLEVMKKALMQEYFG